MNGDMDFLSDSTEQTMTRFVCFVTHNLNRFDLAITTTDRFYGKKLVINMLNGKTAIIGKDDLDEEGFLERIFNLNEEEASELNIFLSQVVGAPHFSDD